MQALATNGADGGPSSRVQLQHFPNPTSSWTACPVEAAVKRWTRRRQTPHNTPTRHGHAAPCMRLLACGSLHLALCIRRAERALCNGDREGCGGHDQDHCRDAFNRVSKRVLRSGRGAFALSSLCTRFYAGRALPCARFYAGRALAFALAVRSPCARLAFALRSLLRWPCARFARAYVKHLPRLIMPAPCLPSATSAFRRAAASWAA